MDVSKERRRLTVSRVDSTGQRGRASAGEDWWGSTIELLDQKYSGKKILARRSQLDKDGAKRQSFHEKDQSSEGVAQEALLPGIGMVCKKGMKPEAPNQDSYAFLSVDGEFALYGVFDGHGPYGHNVSDRARDILVAKFLQHEERDTDTKKAFEFAFVETQNMVVSQLKDQANNSGSTCTMAFHDMKKNTIVMAHVGDSRGVMAMKKKKASAKYDKTEALTVDHKPELPEEKSRIEKNGGRVVFDGYFNYRVFAKAGMYPGLNMSRALGDHVAHKEAGLTALPEIKVLDLNAYAQDYEHIKLIICSDGVWEFITSEAVVDWIGDKDQQQAAQALAHESYKLWMKDSDDEISDDITVILVDIDLQAPA
jgi:serine/threonine protein phosphatase PrpC